VLTSSAANTGCTDRNSPRLHDQKSVPRGRFFVWAVLLWCICSPGPPARATGTNDEKACHTNTYNEKALVKHVIDGDTVVLADDRHIRLIGINAPEIGHDGRPSQPGANEAFHYLTNLLRTQKTVYLHYDRERFDRYQRTLAHLFLGDGTNIQALLLDKGLATTLTIPPNLEFVECYANTSREAETHHIGLWALKQYQPMPVALITSNDLGYRIITGRIIRVIAGRSALWIRLAKNLSLSIANDDLHYFKDVEGLEGKQVRARGLLYASNGEYRMRIRYPVDMNIIDSAGGD
jgi:micrococcal nuclease